MANQLPLLENLTKPDIRELMNACVSFDAKNILGLDYEEVISYGIPKLKLYWKTKKEFEKDIRFITSTKSIIEANKKLEGRWASAPNKPIDANRPTKAQLETLEEEQQFKEASQKKAVEDAKKSVEAAIKKQKELAEATKNSKVYVKTKLPKPADLTDDQAKSIETLRNAAKANPQKLTQELAKIIEEKVKSSLPAGVSQEEANLIYKQTAFRIVANLQGNSLAEESVTQNNISRDKNTLPKIVTDTETLNSFKYSAQGVSDPKILEYTLTRRLTSAAFGESFADNVFGPEKLSDISVDFSPIPKGGFGSYDLPQIPNQYSELLGNQNSFIGSLKNFGEGEIRSQLLSQTGTWLDTQVARLPAQSFLAQSYNSELVQGALSYFGLGNPVAWEGTTFFGRIAIENGLGPVLGWAQNLTGINFGISKAVSAIATDVVGNTLATSAVTGVGTEIAAGTVGATVGAGAGVAIGQVVIPIPVVGAAIGAALTWIGTKLAKLIPPGTLKKWSAAILGGVAGLIALPFVGLGSALGIGLGTAGISAALGGGLGGLTLGGIGSGIAGFFGALGGAFLGAVGTPILVTLLVFPIVVALILFIINSGAYIVPPTSSTGLYNSENPYISVEKTAGSKSSFDNSALPLTVEYTIKITAKISPLTNVHLDYKCEVLKKDARPNCPDIGDSVPGTDEIGTISPSNSYSFKYTMTYSDGSFTDSVISDTITATADTPEKSGVTTSGSASIIIGKPDIGCYKVLTTGQYAVPSQYMTMYNDSIFKIIQDWPAYVAKTCPANGGLVNIGYGGPDAYWGWHLHRAAVDFILYQQPVSTTLVRTEFTMIHELGHHIEKVNPQYYIQYVDYPGIVIPICSYFATWDGSDEAKTESFSETMGLYGSGRSLGDSQSCAGETATFKEKYPINWKFADTFIFH